MSLRGAGAGLIALQVTLAACSTPAAPTPGEPSATGPSAPNAPLAVEPIPFDEIDDERVDALMSEGLTEAEAVFLALTDVDARRLDAEHYEIVALFPTGNEAQTKVTLAFDAVGDPEVITVTHAEADGVVSFRIEYFVSYDDIPADVLTEMRDGSAATGRPVAMAGPLVLLPMTAQEKSGIRVVVESTVKQGTTEGIEAFVGYLDTRLNTGGSMNLLLAQIQAMLSIADAASLSQELATIEKRIDQLEECARNPTNPLTKRQYQQDPQARQRILDRIASVRIEVKMNVAVMYVGMLNETASGLVKAPGLSYVVGAGTAWSAETLRKLNQELLEELRKMITECTGYQFEMVGRAHGTARGQDARITFHYWGLLCPHAEEWRIWEVVDGDNLDGYVRQAPEEAAPIMAHFDASGQTVIFTGGPTWSSEHTSYGTTFTLSTPDAPTTVTATIPFGEKSFDYTEEIVPADGTIDNCD